jgi:hypothetical protein
VRAACAENTSLFELWSGGSEVDIAALRGEWTERRWSFAITTAGHFKHTFEIHKLSTFANLLKLLLLRIDHEIIFLLFLIYAIDTFTIL